MDLSGASKFALFWLTGIRLIFLALLTQGFGSCFFVAPEALTRLFERMQYGEHYALYLKSSLVIGVYLTWAGFTSPLSNGRSK